MNTAATQRRAFMALLRVLRVYALKKVRQRRERQRVRNLITASASRLYGGFSSENDDQRAW